MMKFLGRIGNRAQYLPTQAFNKYCLLYTGGKYFECKTRNYSNQACKSQINKHKNFLNPFYNCRDRLGLPPVGTSVYRSIHFDSQNHKHDHNHNHSHSHSHNKLDKSTSRTLRITYTGVIVNIALAIGKGIAGYFGDSYAMMADAAHSLTDLVSDAVAVWALKVSSIPKDENHPWGHGRFENLGALGISGILIATGVGIGYHSFLELLTPHSTVPSMIALGAALVSIFSKELLFRVTLKIGQEERSGVVVANAYHHRSDSFSSIVALVGITGSMFGMEMLDPIAGIFVAGLITKSGFSNGIETIRELMDEAVDKKIIDDVIEVVKKVEGVLLCKDVRARKMGSNILMDMNIVVKDDITVSDAYLITEKVRQAVLASNMSISEVLIRTSVERTHEHEHEHENELQQNSPTHTNKEIEEKSHEILKDVSEITHSHVHIDSFDGKLNLDVEIWVDDNLAMSEIKKIVANTKDKLSKLQGVNSVQISLKLDDIMHPEK